MTRQCLAQKVHCSGYRRIMVGVKELLGYAEETVRVWVQVKYVRRTTIIVMV